MDKPRFRRFTGTVADRGHDAEGPFVRVYVPERGRSFRLEPWELQVAECFDGYQDAAQRRESATTRLAREVSSGELEAFANELSIAGLLEPGTEEPLPVPPQTRREHDTAWDADERDAEAVPSSTMPGTLSGYGRVGGVGGNQANHRGEGVGLLVSLPARIAGSLGHLLSWPLWVPLLPLLMALLAIGGLWGLWTNRWDAARDALELAQPLRLLLNAVTAAVLVNVLTQCARASTIRRASGEWPAFGIRLVGSIVPSLYTSTEGPAERVDQKDRVRVILSAPLAVLWLLLGAMLGWFLTRGGATYLPVIFLGLTVVSLIVLLLRLNPLARLDGYHWLAHRLGMPDLREQAIIRLFGFQRPWATQQVRNGRALALYGLASFLWIAAVVVLILLYPGRWIAGGYGGTGVLVFAAVFAFLLWNSVRRVRSKRGHIGGGLRAARAAPKAPSARQWLLIGLLAILAMWPYRFEPAGRATVLPYDRAEVRATLPGDVRKVLAAEGDAVSEGDVIVQLGDEAFQAQVARSRADVARLEAQLRLAEAGARDEEVATAEQRVATARERYTYAKAEARRAERAFKQKAISPQDHEAALANAAVRAQELAEAEASLTLVKSGTRDENIEALEAELESARAQLAYNQQQVEDARLRAPIDGHIVSGDLLFARGMYLERGDLIAEIENTETLLTEILLPEASAEEVEIGAPVRLRVWSQPVDTVGGRVTHIAPAAEDSEYGHVIRVRAELHDTGGAVLPGMTGQAKIEGQRYPAIVVFTRALVRFVTVQVWSWLP